MTDDDLDALLAASLLDRPRASDSVFVEHNAKRVALRELIARETKVAIRRGIGDLAFAVALIVMLMTWAGLIRGSFGVPGIVMPLLIITFWSIGHDWSFPDFSFGAGR